MTIFLLQCQDYKQEFEPEPNIFAVMKISSPKYDYQEILVDQTYDIKDTLESPEFFEDVIGVTGAKVTVCGLDDTFYFEEAPWGLDQPGHYFTLYQSPLFNDTTLYTLEVHLPWGDTVTGQAFMPTPLEIIWPEERTYETISISAELRDSHRISWNSCNNVSKYVIYCEPYFGLISEGMYFPSFTGDTSYAFFAERNVWPWSFGKEYELIVVGITPEYDRYTYSSNPGKSNLSSGYGLFGGVTLDTRLIYIVE
ncbi:hypothetical protein CEE36_04510 [candidate division TA06 bacterium B3_TA06]|uniref:DUF4249 domain-containing protein n=1 Tax=candidate division TA06 bacterium B3_TA06 TaxID=2012487 RepID=A0A532V7Y1_UNCT6|nr:MAG: hypothetical protein CEE36_04510 [candidate division TA06 bacterium B3_TA06]